MQFFIHYFLHLAFPGLVAWLLFRKNWKTAWVVLLLTMAVDVDHLFAEPVYDPSRCSIGFHFLHQPLAIGSYLVALLIPNKWIRWISIGLLLHMATDLIDCLWLCEGALNCLPF